MFKINKTSKSNIKVGYRTDHSMISIVVGFANKARGPGIFKLNNTLLLDNEYQKNIINNIKLVSDINKDAKPNTLWEI